MTIQDLKQLKESEDKVEFKATSLKKITDSYVSEVQMVQKQYNNI